MRTDGAAPTAPPAPCAASGRGIKPQRQSFGYARARRRHRAAPHRDAPSACLALRGRLTRLRTPPRSPWRACPAKHRVASRATAPPQYLSHVPRLSGRMPVLTPDRCPLPPCAPAEQHQHQPVCLPPTAERSGGAGRCLLAPPTPQRGRPVLAPPRLLPTAAAPPAQGHRGSGVVRVRLQRSPERAPGRQAGAPSAQSSSAAGDAAAAAGGAGAEQRADICQLASAAAVCSVLPFLLPTELSQVLPCVLTYERSS